MAPVARFAPTPSGPSRAGGRYPTRHVARHPPHAESQILSRPHPAASVLAGLTAAQWQHVLGRAEGTQAAVARARARRWAREARQGRARATAAARGQAAAEP